jgi:hypothetical protein
MNQPILYSEFVDSLAEAALGYLKALVAEAEALSAPPKP